MKSWISLNSADNVAIAVGDQGLAPGEKIEILGQAPVREVIPRGHKVATRRILKGSPILKFGHVIGVASLDIEEGRHVHIHNVIIPPLSLIHDVGEIGARAHEWKARALPKFFQGYLRADGSVGVRNYLVVVASVNCSATVVKSVCRHFQDRDLSCYGLDGIVPITHASGCAQAVGGLNYRVLNRTLAGWVFHPNVVGGLVIGLGCEGTTFKSILEHRQLRGSRSEIPLESLNIQDSGGTAATIKAGIERVSLLLDKLPKFARQEVSVSNLNLALNCGGSDAFSSLTANPALGVASDILVEAGGTVALAEIPECHGCEDMLLARASDPAVQARLREIFAWWQDYAIRQKVTLNENLAPGNIAGGITTIIEKSLGAVAKAGSSPLTQVMDYSEPITAKGFTLMNTPGFDPVSVTGLVAGGCNMVAFTTGRGSVYGCGIAPTIKIATQTEMFERMRGDMDIDAGRALNDGNVEEVGVELYRMMIEVASGRKTCSEELGLGWEEFVPWPIAETL